MNTLASKSVHAVFACVMACVTGGAHGAVFCVGNGDDLNAALDTAESAGGDQSNVIRVRAGTHYSYWEGFDTAYRYELSATNAGRNLEISGGWNSNCSAQTQDPRLTVLNGAARGSVLKIGNAGNPAALDGTIAVRNLTIANGSAEHSVLPALSINVYGVLTASVRVENVMVTGNQGMTAVGVTVISETGASAGSIFFRNNVIQGNVLGSARTGAVIEGDAIAYVSNNSIHDNSGTSNTPGMIVRNVATLSNNVFADNTSSNHPPHQVYQIYTENAAGLTLRNNHWNVPNFSGTLPFSQTGTTTGDAGWTRVGALRIPNITSPLRDSGLNNPLGGTLASDVRGQTRIFNGTIDRGAVESSETAAVGPTIVALQPLVGSTTIVAPEAGPVWTERMFFTVQGGNGSGQSSLDCEVVAGNAVIVNNPFQTVSVGAIGALPVDIAFPAAVPGASASVSNVTCTVSRENNTPYTMTYYFVVQDSQLFRDGFE
jgi:hypothetical protein